MVGAVVGSPLELRHAIRSGRFEGLTTGHAPGRIQANLAVVPAFAAADFVAFCRANTTACPILAVGHPGEPDLPQLGADLDVRTDLPAYRIYRDGHHTETVGDISSVWRPDHVAVAIGCWFSMEDALAREGVRLRHVELGIQGPLFRTSRPSIAQGRFAGPLVVSMRPFAPKDVATVRMVTGRFTRVHGAPIHEGDPSALGIADLTKPDFGEPIPILEGDVPLYWGCGLTGLAALEKSGISLFITHAPGAMLVTDLLNDDLADEILNVGRTYFRATKVITPGRWMIQGIKLSGMDAKSRSSKPFIRPYLSRGLFRSEGAFLCKKFWNEAARVPVFSS